VRSAGSAPMTVVHTTEGSLPQQADALPQLVMLIALPIVEATRLLVGRITNLEAPFPHGSVLFRQQTGAVPDSLLFLAALYLDIDSRMPRRNVLCQECEHLVSIGVEVDSLHRETLSE